MTMTYRNSPPALGAMMFGTTLDEERAFALLDRFVERGGIWIDTANCYTFWASASGAGGDSERLLGRWLAARPGARDQVRLSTKVGAEPLWPGSWPTYREGLSRRAVLDGLEGSLRRLGVETVDMLWVHQEDRTTPAEETADALGEVVAAGKAGRVGASNHPAWWVERARGHARRTGAAPVDAVQLLATYLQVRPGLRTPGVEHRFGVLDDEQRDHAEAVGLEVWGYGPLLSGTYDNPAKELGPEYEHEGTVRRRRALEEVAASSGLTRSQVVLAWLLAHGIRPVIGVSSPAQLDLALDAGLTTLDAQQLQVLDRAG